MPRNWQVIGVAGTTCAGKTTLVNHLVQLYPNAVVLHHDDFFRPLDDAKHTICILSPSLSHINFEILSSLDNDRFLNEIHRIIDGPTPECIPSFLILDGFLLLNEPRIAELCDVKFYLTLDKETCWKRRSVRVYDPADPPGYFQQIVWPSHEKHKALLEDLNDVIYLNGMDSPSDLYSEARRILIERGLLKST